MRSQDNQLIKSRERHVLPWLQSGNEDDITLSMIVEEHRANFND